MTAERQTDQKRIKIKYKPREQFRSFHNRKQRWSVLVCHRRAGKTVATLNDLIRGQSTNANRRVSIPLDKGAYTPNVGACTPNTEHLLGNLKHGSGRDGESDG
jgi:hypothetical protein